MDLDKDPLCIVCGEPSKRDNKLLYDVNMVKDLLVVCKEKAQSGDLKSKTLYLKLSPLDIVQLRRIGYHKECRKGAVRKRSSTSSSSLSRRPGRPSKGQEPCRPKRVKAVPLEEFCMFKSCEFCCHNKNFQQSSKTKFEELITCESDEIGYTLINIKANIKTISEDMCCRYQ